MGPVYRPTWPLTLSQCRGKNFTKSNKKLTGQFPLLIVAWCPALLWCTIQFLFREWQWWTSVSVYLEGDEDDEVGQVEAEHLGAGGGSGHHLQGGGEQWSILGGGQAWEYHTITRLCHLHWFFGNFNTPSLELYRKCSLTPLGLQVMI